MIHERFADAWGMPLASAKAKNETPQTASPGYRNGAAVGVAVGAAAAGMLMMPRARPALLSSAAALISAVWMRRRSARAQLAVAATSTEEASSPEKLKRASSGEGSGTMVLPSDAVSFSGGSSSTRGNRTTDESAEPVTSASSDDRNQHTSPSVSISEDDHGEKQLPNVFEVPGTLDLVTLEDLQRHPRPAGDEEEAEPPPPVVAQQVHNMQSATKLMARQLGYTMPPDLPADCSWMELPSIAAPFNDDAQQPTLLFPGIIGGPELFEELVPRFRSQKGGTIAIRYSTALMLGCTTWQELILRYTELVRQVVNTTNAGDKSSPPLRLVAYSFGCRIAYAVASLLEVERHRVQLVLIDGPIGGPRGTLNTRYSALLQARGTRSRMTRWSSPRSYSPS